MKLWSKKVTLGSALVTGALLGLGFANAAQAEFSIAYCDGKKFAVNIYRAGDPEAPGAGLTMRIYDRAERVMFLTAPANRLPNPEGYNYTNQLGENQWTLFVPNATDLSCTLSRNGQVMDSGTVTRREPPSGD